LPHIEKKKNEHENIDKENQKNHVFGEDILMISGSIMFSFPRMNSCSPILKSNLMVKRVGDVKNQPLAWRLERAVGSGIRCVLRLAFEAHGVFVGLVLRRLLQKLRYIMINSSETDNGDERIPPCSATLQTIKILVHFVYFLISFLKQ
jgi:hypothetical protein